jgi:hypothetical protein
MVWGPDASTIRDILGALDRNTIPDLEYSPKHVFEEAVGKKVVPTCPLL